MAKDDPISVVIPTFNSAQYLLQAIDSVRRQTRPAHEIIVVDDGSTDATSGLMAGAGGAVRYLRQQQRRGAGAARNRGIAAARGALLAFLDADDLWPSGKLARQLETLQGDPRLDAVFGQVVEFESLGSDSGAAPRPAVRTRPQPAHVPGAMLARRCVFDRVGGFVETVRLGETVDWYLRAKEVGLRTAMLDQVVLYRRVHAANSGRRDVDKRGEYLRVLKAALDRRRAQNASGKA